MIRSRLFGNNIEPSCSYCENGDFTKDNSMILCEKQGVVAPYYSCKKFIYAPLKRIPKKDAPLPSFDKSDFDI